MRNLILVAKNFVDARRGINEEQGQTAIEYALVVGLISVVVVAALAIAAGGWITQVDTLVDTAIPG